MLIEKWFKNCGASRRRRIPVNVTDSGVVSFSPVPTPFWPAVFCKARSCCCTFSAIAVLPGVGISVANVISAKETLP